MKPRSFGEYVTAARKERGYSIRQLATQIGVAPSSVMRIEHGTLTVPQPDLFLSLVDALDLDLAVAVSLVHPYHTLCRRFAELQDAKGKV